MSSLTNGDRHVAVGKNALVSCTTSHANTAVGANCLDAVTTGHENTAVGEDAGGGVTTGQYNTILGHNSGVNVTTGFHNIVIGHSSQTAAAGNSREIVIGTDIVGIGSNYFTFGRDSVGRVYNQYSANASWTRSSDVRLKKDIQTNTDLGLDFINDLRTVTYKWKAPSELDPSLSKYDADKTEATYTNKMYGFIAQEVKQALDNHNVTDFNGWHVTDEDDAIQGISYEMFVMPLVKAVQELSAENTALKARLDAGGL